MRMLRTRPVVSRRTLLRGLLGGAVVSVGLPPLEAFLDAHGERYLPDAWAAGGDDGFPRRFGLFYWGNGMLPDRWTPKGEGKGDAWSLSDQLAPLLPLKSKISVVTGTRLGIPNAVPHYAGAAGILTGRPVIVQGQDETFGGPSIDQVMAGKLGELTRFRSLEMAVEGHGLSYNGPNSQNPVEKSPFAVFERLFGVGFTLPGETPIVDPSLGLRRSILDAVGEDAQRLGKLVGSADKQRLDAHLESIRGLEKRLAKLEDDPPDLAACALPTQPEQAYPHIEGRPQLVLRNKVMAELAAMALACDQTRVVSQWLTHPVSNVLFQGASAGHHQLTHDEPGEQPEVHAITVQCVEMLRDFLLALDKVQEGAGTLLDHMVVLGCSEVSLGKTHSLEEMPIVLAGSCGGKLQTDLHYRSQGGENTSKVLLSLTRACGLDLPAFGAEGGEVKDGLGAIEA